VLILGHEIISLINLHLSLTINQHFSLLHQPQQTLKGFLMSWIKTRKPRSICLNSKKLCSHVFDEEKYLSLQVSYFKASTIFINYL